MVVGFLPGVIVGFIFGYSTDLYKTSFKDVNVFLKLIFSVVLLILLVFLTVVEIFAQDYSIPVMLWPILGAPVGLLFGEYFKHSNDKTKK